MTERINVAELPEFDASMFLDSDEAVAVYLNDILQASDPALLAAALDDIVRACESSLPERRSLEQQPTHRKLTIGQLK